VDLVGLHGGEWFGAAAGRAVAGAAVVAGAPRHLASVELPAGAETVDIDGDLGGLLDRVVAWRAAGRRVCLLVSGDPGFFGLARLAGARLGAGGLRIHPAPSSVALAFARLGRHWDDAAVVSVHGRDAGPAVEAALHHPKVAMLCSPAAPPECIGRLLVGAGAGLRTAAVASRMGEPDEAIWEGDLESLAAGTFDGLSVLVVEVPDRPAGAGWSWGLAESAYAHRDGMITKSEVRAVALGKLDLLPTGVMWDVGAGSGSVSAECARLAPGLRIFAVERRGGDIGRLTENVGGLGPTVVEGTAPGVLADLPDPDRAFVGGGGLDVLDAVLARLRPGGTVVATYAAPGRAAEAAARLGQMVQVSVSRGVPAGPDGALRLAAENPVFVCWGPSPS
jgi:precorrin-6Y C5,15-methyltransferase (decarboxylating)